MTWGEFKTLVEKCGVGDDMTVISIGFIGNAVHEAIGVFVDVTGFSVFGDHRESSTEQSLIED